LKEINAVIPVKNPAYDSTAKVPEPGKKTQKAKKPVDNKTSDATQAVADIHRAVT